MTFIIDRFEGEFAVVEANEKTYNIAKALLPDDAKEGSVIEVKVDKEATEKAKNEAADLLKDLFGTEE